MSLLDDMNLTCSMSSLVFFFFKQKTAYEMRISDWSSDVCSSDLQSLTDRSNASRTLLLDIGRGEWCDVLLRRFDLGNIHLPRLVPSAGICARVQGDRKSTRLNSSH